MLSEELQFTRADPKSAQPPALAASASLVAGLLARSARAWAVVALSSLLLSAHYSHISAASQLLLVSSIPLLLLHKPWRGKIPTPAQLRSVASNAVFMSASACLWVAALAALGPARILLLERVDVLLHVTLTTTANRSRRLITVLLSLAAAVLCAMPHVPVHKLHIEAGLMKTFEALDEGTKRAAHAALLPPPPPMSTSALPLIQGICIFAAASVCAHIRRRSLVPAVIQWGGGKRLHAATVPLAALLAAAAALVSPFISPPVAPLHHMLPTFQSSIIALLLLTASFYADAVCVSRTSRLAYSLASSCAAAALAFAANHAAMASLAAADSTASEILAQFVVPPPAMVALSVVGILLGTAGVRPHGGGGGGGITKQLPMFLVKAMDEDGDVTDDEHAKQPHGDMTERAVVFAFFRHIKRDKSAKRIFAFLGLNFCFMFVEAAYGYWSNSLSLIADSGHMFFDCSALVIGLFGSFMSSWAANDRYTFGYGRYEVLSGFTNGILLVFVSLMVLGEGIGRLFGNPEIDAEHLTIVAVAGFCVNLIGLFAFHDLAHSHGGSAGCDHSHAHVEEQAPGHSHVHDASCAHDHGDFNSHSDGHTKVSVGEAVKKGAACNHAKNSNISGVYLHIMADTLGSLGVIISTVLIQRYGWTWTDAFMSIMIAVLIFVSVIPLVKETGVVLLQGTPVELFDGSRRLSAKLSRMRGVACVMNCHVWRHDGSRVMGAVSLQCSGSCDQEIIRRAAHAALNDVGVTDCFVDVELHGAGGITFMQASAD